ncbi:hypothetical protein C8K36_11050 [Rhodococcus sp. OK519]|uniref:hypothetical protein n=1 Tax=Rhodococcus sp. OK519 TaxID=2135729 RepID=UPI000D3677FC|nr:hypothetical protein C8K36_11050 [Rhodococcus sp. OK519]
MGRRRILALVLGMVVFAGLFAAAGVPAANAQTSSAATPAVTSSAPSWSKHPLPCDSATTRCQVFLNGATGDSGERYLLGTNQNFLTSKLRWWSAAELSDQSRRSEFSWNIDTVSTTPYFMVRQNAGTGKCLYNKWTRLDFSPLSAKCDWNDDTFLWYVRPVDQSPDAFQIVSKSAGECWDYHGRSDHYLGTSFCDANSAWQRIEAVNESQRALLTQLALRYAYWSCTDPATGADTGKCEFAADGPPSAVAQPVVRTVCPSDRAVPNPYVNESTAPVQFTTVREATSEASSQWREAVKVGASADGLFAKVLKVSGEYTKEWGGARKDGTRKSETVALTAPARSVFWFYDRTVELPIPGTWTFDKGTGHSWTYKETVNVPVVGKGGASTMVVQNSAPIADFDRNTFNCTMNGSPTVRDGGSPAVDIGRGLAAPVVGQSVTVTNGTWNSTDTDWTYSYQWMRDDEPIVGATERALAVSEGEVGKRLWAKVAAHHPGYLDGHADSARTAPVAPAPKKELAATTTSAPPTTAPSTTAPSTTVPPTTVPPTTAPSTTVPLTTTSPVIEPSIQASSTVPPSAPATTADTAPVPADTSIAIAATRPGSSTADDPLSLTVRVSSPASGLVGIVTLYEVMGDGTTREIDRAAVGGTGGRKIATATFDLPDDLTPGTHTLRVVFTPNTAGHSRSESQQVVSAE